MTFWDFVQNPGNIALLVVACGFVLQLYVSWLFKKDFAKYKATIDQELTKLKAGLDTKTYISKVRFDKEFESYQKLSEKILEMIVTNSILFPQAEFVLEQNEDERKKERFRRHNDAMQAHTAAYNAIIVTAPFISEKLHILFDDVRNECWKQIIGFRIIYLCGTQPTGSEMRKMMEEYQKRNEEITMKPEEIILKMREHLKTYEQ